MSEILTSANQVVTKIKCPRHFLISPKWNEDIYVREIVPELKDVSQYLLDSGQARNTRIKRDLFGNKLVDWRKLYEEESKENGNVIQPWVTRAEAIETVWDSKNPICVLKCKGKCRKGMGVVREHDIKRLHG